MTRTRSHSEPTQSSSGEPRIPGVAEIPGVTRAQGQEGQYSATTAGPDTVTAAQGPIQTPTQNMQQDMQNMPVLDFSQNKKKQGWDAAKLAWDIFIVRDGVGEGEILKAMEELIINSLYQAQQGLDEVYEPKGPRYSGQAFPQATRSEHSITPLGADNSLVPPTERGPAVIREGQGQGR